MSRFSVEDRARNSTMPVGTYAWLSEPHLLCVLFVIFLVAVGFGTVGELLARLGPNLEPLGVGQEAGGYTRAACSLRYVGLLLEKSPECWGKLRRHVSCKLFVFRQCETEPCSRTPRQCMTPLGLNTTRRTHLGPGPGFHLQGQGMRVRRACAQRTLASPRCGVSPQRAACLAPSFYCIISVTKPAAGPRRSRRRTLRLQARICSWGEANLDTESRLTAGEHRQTLRVGCFTTPRILQLGRRESHGILQYQTSRVPPLLVSSGHVRQWYRGVSSGTSRNSDDTKNANSYPSWET